MLEGSLGSLWVPSWFRSSELLGKWKNVWMSLVWWFPVGTNILGWCLDFILVQTQLMLGCPRWLSSKEFTCQCRSCRRHGFDPWIEKIPWRMKWQSTPVLLPRKSHGQRSLMGYSSCKNWLMTKSQTWLIMHAQADRKKNHISTYLGFFCWSILDLWNSFQTYSKVIQLYICIYYIHHTYFRLFSIVDYYKILNIILCAIQ